MAKITPELIEQVTRELAETSGVSGALDDALNRTTAEFKAQVALASLASGPGTAFGAGIEVGVALAARGITSAALVREGDVAYATPPPASVTTN